MKSSLPLIFMFSMAFPQPVSGQQVYQTPSADVRRNIQINVQINRAGYSQQNREPYRTQHQAQETQFLMIMDGLEGRLFIGKQVPYTVWFRDFLKDRGYFDQEIIFRNVGTSLVVTPRIRGNQIEVTLTPEISYETNDGRGAIAVTSLSTTVLVPNGQTIEVGGSARKSEFADHFYRNESGEVIRISLTPKITEF